MRRAALACEREVAVWRAAESWVERLMLDWAIEERRDMLRWWRCLDSVRRARMEATVAFKCFRTGSRSGTGLAGGGCGSCANVSCDIEGSRMEDALLALGVALLLRSTSEDVCSLPRVRPSS